MKTFSVEVEGIAIEIKASRAAVAVHRAIDRFVAKGYFGFRYQRPTMIAVTYIKNSKETAEQGEK